jgi:hypothetical protein
LFGSKYFLNILSLFSTGDLAKQLKRKKSKFAITAIYGKFWVGQNPVYQL